MIDALIEWVGLTLAIFLTMSGIAALILYGDPFIVVVVSLIIADRQASKFRRDACYKLDRKE